MKKLSYLISGALALPTVMADLGTGCFGDGMMGWYGNYGMMGGVGFGLYHLLWVSLIAFVFALVFWSTYKWLMSDKKGKRR